MKSPLVELLISNLPDRFLSDLHKAITLVYPRSYGEMLEDPALDEKQAHYALGHYRRALAETALKRVATQHKLAAKDVQPAKGGCTYVHITAGRFILAMCHVSCEGQFPVHSNAREQSSEINKYAEQRDMFPVNSGGADDHFYGIFVHNEERGQKGTFGSLCIGFPKHRYAGWIEEPTDVAEILRQPIGMSDRVEVKKPKLKVTKPEKVSENT